MATLRVETPALVLYFTFNPRAEGVIGFRLRAHGLVENNSRKAARTLRLISETGVVKHQAAVMAFSNDDVTAYSAQ
jgi:hypothetical protein